LADATIDQAITAVKAALGPITAPLMAVINQASHMDVCPTCVMKAKDQVEPAVAIFKNIVDNFTV
jgi:hypothetical protein